jgi:isopentenyl diphosphate isomerase/L-lactate dehydrogenase-like FMN-dependent dehydrogenase
MILADIEDARRLARRRVPKIFFDYMDGGSFGEATQRANAAGFDAWRLEQRVLVDVSRRDLSAPYLGARHALPFMLGPVGFAGTFAPRGEVLAARAAGTAGIPFCLSTFSICSLEEVRAAFPGPLHFQLYILKDRGLSASMIERAARAGVAALHLTVDTAVTAVRERDVRNGFRSITRPSPGLVASFLRHPRWCLGMARAGMPQAGNVADRPEMGRGLLAQAASLSRLIDPSLSWADIAWLRERWPGTLVLKGILSADDARRAAVSGADAIVVSNHGGRQLDGAPASIMVLPEIAAAVGDRIEVLFDGGVRRGGDVVKALALGARAVLLGRAYAYGLGAAGEAGVARAIDLIAAEIDLTLALMGLRSIEDLRAAGAGCLRRESTPG